MPSAAATTFGHQDTRGSEDISAPSSPKSLEDCLRRFATHASPRFLVVATLAALAVRAWLGPLGLGDAALVAAIWMLWPLQEWMIHVFILHFEPIRVGRWTLDFEVPRSHRAHHLDPWNLDILFIPPQGYLLGLPAVLVVYFGLMPTPALAVTGVATHLAFSLRYEWVHFLVHTRYRPRSARFERLWRNHRLHHCKNERYWFGVSRIGGDRVLGTAPDPATVALSPTCRTLGIEDAA